MKAVIADEFDGGWRVGEQPDPSPGPNDVLVAVEASGICYTDVQQLRNPAYGGSFPRIPGHEPVGRVVSVGAEVTGLAEGERVGVAYAQRWCGQCEHCIEGRYEHCAAISTTGIGVDGGHAELTLMDAGSVVSVPADLDAAEAAPIMCAGFTVYSGICDAELRPGERCAVVGVGGLGHLALQYAAALGAEVVAVTRSEEKRAMLTELGAHEVLVAGENEVGQALAKMGGVDVILHTANSVEPALTGGLRPYGRLSLMGVTDAEVHTTPKEMIFGKLRIVGSSQGPRHLLPEVIELHRRAKVKTIVESYSLDEAPAGLERVESGTARFRAVLVP